MSTPATIGVDDDLAACEASITLGPANDELSRRIDVQVSVAAVERESRLAVLESDVLQGAPDHLLLDLLVHGLHAWSGHLRALVASALLAPHSLQGLGMLGGDHHSVDLLRLHGAVRVLQVLDGHLGLAVWPQPPAFAALAHVCQRLAQASGHGVCQGHAVTGLITGVAKHDTLVASAHIHVSLANVHATSDVWALLVDADKHFAGLVTQALAVNAGQVVHVAVVADLENRGPHNLVVVKLGLGRDLASHHDHVVLGASLASNFGLWVLPQACVKHSIGDLVAELVRVTLVHRLGREKEGAGGFRLLLRRLGHDFVKNPSN
mmetsp:Transcript_57590/g.103474  ORF Transcript_57590/g.103474 Transcript_57590/m.103474 type:complete len:321 (+) Transcript_57590:618-1580(+)